MSPPTTIATSESALAIGPVKACWSFWVDVSQGDCASAGLATTSNKTTHKGPDTEFTDNAQYWIGECLYGKKLYVEAIDTWTVLIKDHPASDKLPDACVKKGMALERLGRRSQALAEYRYVVYRFPNSQAARIARERLNP